VIRSDLPLLAASLLRHLRSRQLLLPMRMKATRRRNHPKRRTTMRRRKKKKTRRRRKRRRKKTTTTKKKKQRRRRRRKTKKKATKHSLFPAERQKKKLLFISFLFHSFIWQTSLLIFSLCKSRRFYFFFPSQKNKIKTHKVHYGFFLPFFFFAFSFPGLFFLGMVMLLPLLLLTVSGGKGNVFGIWPPRSVQTGGT